MALQTTASSAPQGQISSQLNAMEGDLENINSIANALGRRLLPITGLDLDSPVPAQATGEGPPKQLQVPMADRIEYLRERLNNTSRLLDLILGRIEA